MTELKRMRECKQTAGVGYMTLKCSLEIQTQWDNLASLSVVCLSVCLCAWRYKSVAIYVSRKLMFVISVVKERGIFNFKYPGNGKARSLPHIFTHHTAVRWSRRLATRINKVTFRDLGFLIFRNAEFCQKFLQVSIKEVLAKSFAEDFDLRACDV